MLHCDISSMSFKCSLKAYSASHLRIERIRQGGKIILPESVMHSLVVQRVEFPYLFRLEKRRCADTITEGEVEYIYCGVLEFTSPENSILLPDWIMACIHLEKGEVINIEAVSLPVAKYVSIEPLDASFLTLSNPRAVMEHNLTKFSALTKGICIEIWHNEKPYLIKIHDLKAKIKGSDIGRVNGACILDVDVELEIGSALKTTILPEQSSLCFSKSTETVTNVSHGRNCGNIQPGIAFRPFSGTARSISGKTLVPSTTRSSGAADA